jgi:hypothetical protein
MKQKVGSLKRQIRLINSWSICQGQGGKRSKLIKIRDEKGVLQQINELQMNMMEYFENLYSNKWENLEETLKFLDAFDLPKLNQEDINYL